MHVCIPCVYRYPQRLEEGIRFPGTGVAGVCESPDARRLEPNPGPVQEQKCS